MCVSFCVFGSHIASCRPERLTGVSFAEGCEEPSWQNGGLSPGRTTDVIQTRPCASIIGLWTLFLLFHGRSSPQNSDGFICCCAGAIGVFGSRTVSGTRVMLFLPGSSTGR